TFFFFQAEDGIRDFHVTGVQTCALPIWASSAVIPRLGMAVPGCMAGGSINQGTRCRGTLGNAPASTLLCANSRSGGPTIPIAPRSEERRVGKEGGDRRSRGHDRKREEAT